MGIYGNYGSYGNLWAQWVDLVQSYENKGTVRQHNCPIMWLIVRMTGFRDVVWRQEAIGARFCAVVVMVLFRALLLEDFERPESGFQQVDLLFLLLVGEVDEPFRDDDPLVGAVELDE